MSSPNPRPVRKFRPRQRVLLPYLILLLGLCFTLIVTHYFAKLADEQDRSRFQGTVQEINDRIKARIQTSITLLRAGTGLFAASDDVSAIEFERFVNQIELPKHYEGVQGLGFSLRFSRHQLPQVVDDMRRAGYSTFKVWPDLPAREEYNAILFLQPAINRNEVAIGFDMATEPVRRQAMDQARDSGNPTASGKVTLVQEPLGDTHQAGFLIYAPVYRKDLPLNTEYERRQALLGFIYSPFRVDDFLSAVLAGTHYDVDFEVYDTSEIRSDTQMRGSSSASATEGPPSHSVVQPLDVGNRTWTLVYKAKPSFEAGSNRGFLPYTFTTGILLSLLFFAVTSAEVRARTRAELAAAELRESEATIRNTLEQREAAEEALREGEERYRVLVENANDIVYMLRPDGRITSINTAAETITGYSTGELLSMNIKDLAAAGSQPVIEQMLDIKNDRGARTNFEITIQTKNGNPLTLEVSNRIISKGLVSIQGIARDISMRRRAEETLREADHRALSEYERLLERISGLAVALGTGRELNTIFSALGEFTRVSVPCDGFLVSLYDPIRDVRTACYAWADNKELDISELPPMPITTSGPNSRALRLAQVII
ncbi:MAG TPA: CHASE domain-containing protein, partial [Pyrinomonadaceae bacterium]|nr:CHASE domain-containing protein [Pyrinomonadaceae bacterium]